MKILITIENKKTKIALWEKTEEIDCAVISDEHTLAEKLLPGIDKLLKKNKSEVQNIEKVEIKSDQTDNFTTTRIAKTVAKVWKLRS